MIKTLRVKSATNRKEEIVDISAARDWDYFDPNALVVVENQLVHSFDELLKIASSYISDAKKDTLDVYLMVTLTGG